LVCARPEAFERSAVGKPVGQLADGEEGRKESKVEGRERSCGRGRCWRGDKRKDRREKGEELREVSRGHASTLSDARDGHERLQHPLQPQSSDFLLRGIDGFGDRLDLGLCRNEEDLKDLFEGDGLGIDVMDQGGEDVGEEDSRKGRGRGKREEKSSEVFKKVGGPRVKRCWRTLCTRKAESERTVRTIDPLASVQRIKCADEPSWPLPAPAQRHP
jgi:hypothetical protein